MTQLVAPFAPVLPLSQIAPTLSGFSPIDLPDLFAWYRADLGITKDGSDLVSQWDDQSGNNLHLTSSGTARPTWIAVSSNISNRSVLRFDGTTDKMEKTGFALDQAYTAMAVVYKTGASDRDIYDTHNGAVQSELSYFSGGYNLYAGGAGGVNKIATTGLHWVLAVADGVSSTVRVDEGSAATGNPGTNGIEDLRVGARADDAQFWDGDIAELFFVSRAVTAAEIASIGVYVAARYGI